ncbi:electron transport complex subunit RsxC [Vibrio vulnificus]|uniref:electron transport complex subunit RsxC n=1 Tax=Vibrio vulnificus TaxID=672 RepID=UPI001A1A464C|nr:electron transport complex subunit RsxC [Vibrio vulnificus]MDS1769940.1 electron transport complex subunit RsxC [Vibrio vulnificus]MDS1851607.1 electron transport complex subunit RsxC [Vibrio vulnificus]HAS6320548.1 electron transport complex subunit RsxC [Vibrio vulnificus]HDY7591685.1 electron transport complex subunit RsxC [Vibrio vulnificus]HDY8175534.1 electron transport complex subunit RsxC [Vibrio vulnificus]
MLSLIEQIRTGALWDFPGGVHPAENKRQSNQQPLVHAALANEIVLPLKQHIGKPGNILVNVGDHVLKGQLLTQSNAGFTLPIHASTSGTITAIETRTVAHPSGLSEMCVVITPDGQDTWCEKQPVIDYSQQSSDYLLDVIRMAGISGMGGAGFPTAKKIQSGLGRTEILIVNAAECEPYITADDKLLQEHAEEVLQGIEIVEHILQPKLTIIGIEDNKPEAIKALESAAQNRDIVIRVIPTKYPSGGEKQLIKVLTNKEVPAGGIPADIGILVQNVGSLYAIKRAVMDGEPMVNRVVTLTGNTFEIPRNVWVPLGTPVHALLEQFGYQADKKLPRLIMGGPMMGFSLPHANVPITKTSNCILAPTRKEISPAGYEMECIRCGACAEACPASLLPQQLQWHAKAEEFDKCEELNLKDCIECGACAFVCPSEIPLVGYYRQAKAEIRTRAQEADAAERAKLRFEEKKARMEREKEERENRFKKAAEDRRKEMKSTGGDDAIAAAIARVKAQKTQDSEQAPSVKPAVAAAIAKAKAKQAAAADSGSSEPDNSEMVKLREERKRLARERKAEKEQSKTPGSEEQGDKKSAVAAAIARAKAKKAQQPPLASSESSADEPEDKKAAVAAAIARAKARKAQQTDEPAPEQNREESQPAEDDPKKAAVAAAIARAKARKAQQTDESAPEQNREESQPAEDDPKKAAVAAAIARAKARKAQQTDEPAPEQNREESQPADDDPKKAAVAAAIARAKARKAQQTDEPAPEQNREESQAAEDDPKKAAVAAAIARAKARKAQQTNEPAPEQNREESQATEDDPKKAAVAAAIARAKARKEQQTSEPAPEQNREESQATEDDPKKAAVAAAIARAKARKAQQTDEPAPEQNREESQPAEDDPKKAAVAAAIARAKARKAQQAEQKQNTEENE